MTNETGGGGVKLKAHFITSTITDQSLNRALCDISPAAMTWPDRHRGEGTVSKLHTATHSCTTLLCDPLSLSHKKTTNLQGKISRY